MKRHIYFIVLLLALVSCDKELEEKRAQEALTFSNLSEARVSVNSLYQIGYPDLANQSDEELGLTFAWGAYASKLIESEATGASYRALHTQELTSPNLQALSNRIYKTCSGAVETCQQIIEQIKSSELEQEDKQPLIAEAKVLKAINAFYLIRAYGAYPHKGEVLTLEKAYQMLIKELNEARPYLARKSYQENKGQITAFGAEVLLAEIYLSMSGYPLQANKYNEAYEALKPLLKSTTHRLAKNDALENGKTAYNKLRVDYMNKEYIYAFSLSQASSKANYVYPREAKDWSLSNAKVCFNAFQPSKEYMRFYDEGDLRAKDRQFFNTFYQVKDGDKTVFNVFAPTPYFFFEEGLDDLAHRGATSHIVSYRYAEVLLIAAEVLANKESARSEAVGYLLAVKRRALPDLNEEQISKRLMAMSKEEFLEEVWAERLRELPFEMKFAFDINRTQKYPQAGDKAGIITFEPFKAKPLLLPLPKNL